MGLIDQFIQCSSFNEAYTLLNSFQPNEAVKPQYLFTKGLLGIFMESESTRDEAINGLIEINAFDQLFELGNLYVENQDFINGQKIYEKAEKLDNSDEQKMKLYSNLGVCYLQTGNYDEAISTMEKALNISPKDDITITNLGISFSLKGDNETAQEYLIKAKNNCSSPHQMKSIEMWLEEFEIKDTQKPKVTKPYFLGIGINLVFSLMISPFVFNTYNEHNHGRVMINLTIIFLHLFLIVSLSPFLLLNNQKVVQNPFLSFASAFSGIILTITPIIYYTLQDISESSMHDSSILFVYSSISLLLIWIVLFVNIRRQYNN